MNRHFVQKLLLGLLAMTAATQLNAKVFYASNDSASLEAAIDSVNAGSGNDIIQITGNIVLMYEPPVIRQNVTVTADTNGDGTPKYSITRGNNNGIWVFDVYPKKYCNIENIIVDGVGIGIVVNLYGSEDNPIVKINNCKITNDDSRGIWVNGYSAVQPQIAISNSIFSNNKGSGIDIEGMNTLNAQDITIHNCEANNNGLDGISVRKGDMSTNASIYDCTADGNGGDGITFNDDVSGIINNCSATDNAHTAFDLGIKSKIDNCIAVHNGYGGFWGSCSQVLNCISRNNTQYGFYLDYCSVINNCSAIGTRFGSDFHGKGFDISNSLITNSTAINNEGYGVDAEHGSIINCTFSNNETGVYGFTKIYNSISYANVNADLTLDLGSAIYNTVYNKEIDINDAAVSKSNCRQDDPKLLGMTANGDYSENPDDIVCYALGEGSSALGLADKSVISLEELIASIPDDVGEYVADAIGWFETTVSNEYLIGVLLYDQLGNVRSFNGDRYDAGSISKNIGGTTNSRSIISYSPQRVANYGINSILFYGYGFDANTKISLKKQGENDITPDTYVIAESSIAPGVTTCQAAFDFSKKTIGAWDIVIDFGDTIASIQNGLEIEEYIEPKVEIDLLGSSGVRIGGWAYYTVQYKNLGNVDIYNVPVLIDITTPKEAIVSVKEDWQYIAPEGLDISQVARIDTLIDPFSGLLHTYIAPNVRYIGAYGVGYLSFAIRIDAISHSETFEISASALKPMVIINPDAYSAVSSVGLRSGGPCGLMANPDFSDCMQSAVDIGIEAGMEIAKDLIPGFGCLMSGVSLGCNTVQNYKKMDGLNFAGNLAWDLTKTALACGADFVPITKIGKAVWTTIKVMKTANKWVKRANMGLNAYNNCFNNDNNIKGTIVGSIDPNDKIGPVSESGSTWFSDRKDFTYVIDFENLSTATAPAQEIRITDTLDLNVFDINTFEAGFIKIGARLVEAPFHVQNFTWSVDMPEKGLTTQVELQLDKTKGIAKWYFKCIDPATNDLPTDPLVGFLPPDDDNGSGQGSVVYTIKLKDGLSDNVKVANRASIVFDNNPAINTPEWVNNKDVIPPTSNMAEVSDAGNGLISLKWQGTDNEGGSGVYCYDVYMKQGDADYQMIFSKITETTATIEADNKTEYAFYTIATDNAGNKENKLNVPDMTWTSISKILPDTHNVLLSPNPARTECTVAFDVESPGNLNITLANMLGTNSKKIYDGYAASGRFKYTFDTGSLPTGIYIVLIHTSDRVIGEKLLISR